MTSLEEEVRQGERARAILEDPIVVEAFAELETRCLNDWRSSAAGDIAQRERMFLTIGVIQALREDFSSLITTGRLARRSLADRAAAQAKADRHTA